MDCAEEVAILKRELGPIIGGEQRLAFDLLNEKLTVAVDSPAVTENAILAAVARTGMSARIWSDIPSSISEESFWQRHGRRLLTITSGCFTGAGFLLHLFLTGNVLAAMGSTETGEITTSPSAVRILYGCGILTGAWFVIPRTWSAVIRWRPDMNLLMLIAAVGAAALGDWFEASTVAFLFAFSLQLEKWSVGHARQAVERLLDLTPAVVHLLNSDGQQTDVPAANVAVGAMLLVKPGERFPLDGRVVRGNSDVNQAPITGESIPVPKSPGDPVFAGTINGAGALEIESTKPSNATTLAQLTHLIGEAQSRRSTSEQWVEKFAKVYTPAVLGIALVLLVIPPLLFHGDWYEWLYRALVLLVIACPCALVISTPVSVVAAIAAATRRGVLIKGGAFVEIPGRLQAIAFDKTGTLTDGNPKVMNVFPWNEHSELELLACIASIEARGEHLLAKAIVKFAHEQQIEIRPVEDYQMVPGKGATARLDGTMYWVGSQRYLQERGLETAELRSKLEDLARNGLSVVVVGSHQEVWGYLTLADQIRSNTRTAIESLRRLGIPTIVMLTGDNQPTAVAIAQAAGINDIRANLLPAEKMAAVEQLVSQFGVVAMVGDGVNNAPAMAQATLGIAMGAAGSDAALETADIALMSDDLTRIAWLVTHSRRTLGVIHANVMFSLSIKALFMVLAFAGHTSMWAAIAADMGASLLVIFNSLRLLRPVFDSADVA